MGIQNNEFKKISKFTDLVAWQEGHKLVLMIYSAVKDFPDCEEYGLKSQLQRAGVSYTSNIAEGFAKHSSKEKNKYYNTSHTSLIEIQNQILVARDVGYLSKENFMTLAHQTVVCHKLIIGLIKATRINKFEC